MDKTKEELLIETTARIFSGYISRSASCPEKLILSMEWAEKIVDKFWKDTPDPDARSKQALMSNITNLEEQKIEMDKNEV